MEKTHIPTWAEAKEVRYHKRTRLEHFVYEFDPMKDAEKFRKMLSAAIEQEKRKVLKKIK